MPVIAKLSNEVAEMLDIDPKTGRIKRNEKDAHERRDIRPTKTPRENGDKG
ncbi:MAG: hypothetical protein Q4F74_03970 [Synergistaceae bacterium]|nr:hypothetical protein [Synergistaceae bacterium]